jgi:hypothetical protein
MLRLQARSLPLRREVWEECRHHATLLHRQVSLLPGLLTHHSILRHRLNKHLLRLQGHHREDRHRDRLALVLPQVDLLKADHLVQIQGQVPGSHRA